MVRTMDLTDRNFRACVVRPRMLGNRNFRVVQNYNHHYYILSQQQANFSRNWYRSQSSYLRDLVVVASYTTVLHLFREFYTVSDIVIPI